MSPSVADHLLVGVAALAAGGVNALAGGGTLISFPALVATGVSTKAANITNTVALCPGYFGGTYAQRKDLAAQRHRLPLFAVAAGLGGLTGSVLLLATSEAVFEKIVPFLILGAVALLFFQDKLKPKASASAHEIRRPGPSELVPVYLVSIYGGYFGAGLGIMTLAVLGVLIDDLFTRINALKQAVSFVVNICAAIFLCFSGKVEWSLAAVMAVAALAGGSAGGHLAGRLPPKKLRLLVIVFGLVVGVIYLVRAFR
jgi:uncharacterized membrane protein YfcA